MNKYNRYVIGIITRNGVTEWYKEGVGGHRGSNPVSNPVTRYRPAGPYYSAEDYGKPLVNLLSILISVQMSNF